MLQEKRVGLYSICNYCGISYTAEEAYKKRGNHFFCCKQCIQAYEEENKGE